MSVSSLFGTSKGGSDDGDHWLTVSDLMAGLMVVFLFISIALMQETRKIAETYQDTQVAIYNSLNEEFENDLMKWGAEIDRETLSFNFNSPEVLFGEGEQLLKPRFETILQDFFPRYLTVLEPFKNSINEVRIEGHTSSKWNSSTSDSESYFKNMRLSQGRTRSVLNYIYYLPNVLEQRSWIKRRIAAVGFSSSRLIYDNDGKEDEEKSRRVSFRLITDAESQMRKLLEGLQ